MKKLIVALIVALSMAGCASQSQQTPAQVAARVCPATTDAIGSLQKLTLPAKDAKALAEVAPLVDAVCKAASTVTSDDIRSLSVTALPAIIDIVNASPLETDKKNAVILDLTAVQIIVDSIAAANPPAVAPAPAPAAVVAPAAK